MMRGARLVLAALAAASAATLLSGCLFGDEGDGCSTPVSGRHFRVNVVDAACYEGLAVAPVDDDQMRPHLRFDASVVVTNLSYERLWINSVSMEAVDPRTCATERVFAFASGGLNLRSLAPGETISTTVQGFADEETIARTGGVRVAPERKAPVAVRLGLQDQRGGIYYVVSDAVRCTVELPR